MGGQTDILSYGAMFSSHTKGEEEKELNACVLCSMTNTTDQLNYILNAEAIRNLNKEESAVYLNFFPKMYQIDIQTDRQTL